MAVHPGLVGRLAPITDWRVGVDHAASTDAPYRVIVEAAAPAATGRVLVDLDKVVLILRTLHTDGVAALQRMEALAVELAVVAEVSLTEGLEAELYVGDLILSD